MKIEWNNTYAAIWRQRKGYLRPVKSIDPISLNSLIGIDLQKKELMRNTERFIEKKPANNALLWGSRGTGKSSLVKAVLNEYKMRSLRLIEVDKNDIYNLPEIVDEIRELPFRYIIYCDDFTFNINDDSYMSLKSVLEGSIEKAPENVLLYATSNRRHILPEYMNDNKGTKVINGEIHYSDAVEEKISLSDRFGLWLSFYPVNMDGYLDIVDSYFPDYKGDKDKLHHAAKQFSISRASKSGRTAMQFYNFYWDQNE